MKSKVLITGDTGFIGSALSKACREQAIEVYGASRSGGIDLLDSQALHKLPEINHIFHLAARVGVQASFQNPGKTFEENYLTTLNVLEFARERRVPVIFMSSYMYGIAKTLPINEEHPVSCSNPYGQSKRFGEMLCQFYAESFKIDVTVIRPFNIYGLGENTESVITQWIKQVRSGGPLKVRNLKQKRDYLWIDDLVEALIKVSAKPNPGYHVYNLGFGKNFSVREIIDIIFKITGRELPVESLDQGIQGEVIETLCDRSRFSSFFDWSPRIDISEGIKRLVQAIS